jgi:hypothetical protein
MRWIVRIQSSSGNSVGLLNVSDPRSSELYTLKPFSKQDSLEIEKADSGMVAPYSPLGKLL